METSGVLESPLKTSSSVLTNTQGESPFLLLRLDRCLNPYLVRYGGYSSAGWGHGVRNLVFNSPDPSAGVETWIRLENGDTHARITLDKNY
jgi:hypothetical protein